MQIADYVAGAPGAKTRAAALASYRVDGHTENGWLVSMVEACS